MHFDIIDWGAEQCVVAYYFYNLQAYPFNKISYFYCYDYYCQVYLAETGLFKATTYYYYFAFATVLH